MKKSCKPVLTDVKPLLTQSFAYYHAGFQAFTARLPGNVNYVKSGRSGRMAAR